ncbi:MAG TPA: hypothetical protein VMU67_05330 [Steroidobacteraceae bacterium]|nr:hypothetical protein [Steroidobacteraceae bacterium]
MRHLGHLVILAGLPVLASAGTDALHCDRACLGSLLDRYLRAVVAHTPAAAPLALGYRHTENALNVPPAEGVWRTVTGLGSVQRRYLDPVSGEAAYYGTVAEGAKLAIATVRLRIEQRSVTEAEWYLARDGDPGLPNARPPNAWNPAGLSAHPPPVRVLPANERLSRRALIAIVESYYDAIVSHDGRIALAAPGCERYENGTRVTGRRGGVDDDCVSGFAHFNLANVAARRIPLVDRDTGMVLAMAVFIRKPGSAVPRNAFSEWFAIEGGRIRAIWTAMYYPPADRPVPNWPPYDGDFPLPPAGAATVPAAAPRP